MSLTLYCQSCGSPTQYTEIKPRFCSACSKPYLTGAAPQAPRPAPREIVRERPTRDRGVQTEEDEQVNVPKLNRLEFDIEISGPEKFSIGDLARGEKTRGRKKKILSGERREGANMDEKQILEFLKRQGGTRRASETSYDPNVPTIGGEE